MVGTRTLSDELDDVLVPLSVLRERFRMPERTMRRRLTGITTVRYAGGKAIRWGDAVAKLSSKKDLTWPVDRP